MAVYKDTVHGTWYCKFNYRDWKGNARHTTKRGFRTKRDAQVFEHDFKQSAKEMPDVSVEKLCLDYLAARRPQIRESTYISQEHVFRRHIIPYFGSLRLSELTPLRIAKWQNELLVTVTQKKRTFSPETVKRMRSVFSAALNYGVRYYHLKENPISRVEPVKTERHEMQIWEEKDFYKALQFERTKKNRCILLLLFYGGVRIGELRALTITDFDFERNTISITKSMNQAGHVTPPKNESSNRVISMPPRIMQEIKDYLERQSIVLKYPLRRSNSALSDHLHRLAKQAGLPVIRVHDLRHSHASYLIQHGVPITAISRRLGHRNSSITLSTYSHMYRQNDVEIADMMNKSLSSWSKFGQSEKKSTANPLSDKG